MIQFGLNLLSEAAELDHSCGVESLTCKPLASVYFVLMQHKVKLVYAALSFAVHIMRITLPVMEKQTKLQNLPDLSKYYNGNLENSKTLNNDEAYFNAGKS